MRRFAASIALLVFVTGGASAADMILKAPPAGVLAFNWTGFYFGAHLGYFWGTTSNDGGFPNASANGAFLGVQGGYRHQLPNNVVLGVQVSAPLWAQEQSTTFFGIFNNTAKFKGSILVQGQLGYAWGRWMPFVTAGVGLVRVEGQETTPAVASLVVTNTHSIVTAGLGINYAITDHITTGVRWNHFWTSAERYNCGPVLCPVPAAISFNGDTLTWVLEYKF